MRSLSQAATHMLLADWPLRQFTKCDKKEIRLDWPHCWLISKQQAKCSRQKVTPHIYCVAIILCQVIWFARFRYFRNLVLVNLVKILLLGVALVGGRPCCLLLANGTSTKMKQQINLRFLVTLKKSPTEWLKRLKEVYGESVMSRTQIFEWHKCFKNGREKVEDDPKSERPSTSKTDNIARVKQLDVWNDCRWQYKWLEKYEWMDNLRMRKLTMHLHTMWSVWGSCWSKKKSQLLTTHRIFQI